MLDRESSSNLYGLKKKKITHYQEYSSSKMRVYKYSSGRKERQVWVYSPNLIPFGICSSCYYKRKRLALIRYTSKYHPPNPNIFHLSWQCVKRTTATFEIMQKPL